jgi:outer membrane receptor protein involved in Fe transport
VQLNSSLNYQNTKKIYILTIFIIISLTFFQYKSLSQPRGNNRPNLAKPNKLKPGTAIINGKVVIENDKSPAISAKVALVKVNDSSAVTGTFTKNDGTFQIIKVPEGKFLIKISSIGFQDYFSNVVTVIDSQEVNLKTFEIKQQSILTEETVVTAQKQQIQVTAEGKIVNVENNALASGGSAIDVLQNTPSVSVDFDGNISLRGSSAVNILIDGQQISNSGGSRTALLDNIPASAIESIEIINNPGAKYNPEGTGGLLNIKLKKRQNVGFNGLVGFNIGTRDKYNGTANFNWGFGKLNTFFSSDLRIDNRYREGTTNRLNFVFDSAAYLKQNIDGDRSNLSNNSRVGFDYLFDEKNTMTMSLNYNYRDSKGGESLLTDEYSRDFGLSADPKYLTYADLSRTEDTGTDNSFVLSTNYTKKFDTPKEIFTIDLNYSNNQSIDYRERNTNSFTIVSPFSFRSNRDNKSQNLIFNGNYALPLVDKSKIEMGWNTNFRNIRSYYKPELFSFVDNIWNSFDSLVNDFTYEENIYAVYGTYSNKYDAFDMQLGLRIESAQITLLQAQNNSRNDINYNSFFPTIGLKYSFSETDALNFNYSRRINRPDIGNLNPFIEIDNPRLNTFGNPNVKPEYIDALELGWSSFFEKRSLITSLFYRNVNNAIRRYSYLDTITGITNLSFNNFDDSQFLGIEFIEEETLASWWKMTTTFSVYHNRINGNAALGIQGNENNSWNLKVNSTVNMWWGIDLQAFGSYASPVATQQGEIKRFFNIDLALKKDITDDLTVTFRVSDIFNTLNFGVNSYGIGFESDIYRKRETRVGFLNISYKINSGIKQNERKRPEGSGGGDMDM